MIPSRPKEIVVLDFGPDWGQLIIPTRSKLNRELKLREGDRLEVSFKCEKKRR